MLDNQIEEIISFKNRHQLFVFISASIVIALVIVSFSMAIYNWSGAAQLDLSRPGYKSVRAQSSNGVSSYKSFSPFGDLDQKVIKEFRVLFIERTQKIKQADAFSGDPLSPEALDFIVTIPTN